tara:strand:- start:68 stop:316 length:249 start_codon:yes stop_codon:yes gene_type:complete
MKKLALLTITVIIRPVSNFIFHIRKWLNTEITQGLLYRLHGYPITRKESLKRNGEIIMIIIAVIFFIWFALTTDKPLPSPPG